MVKENRGVSIAVFALLALLAFIVIYEFNQFVLPVLRGGEAASAIPQSNQIKTYSSPAPGAEASGIEVAGAGENTEIGRGAEELIKLDVCGNGVCEEVESCGSCAADCGCKAGQYCSGSAICRPRELCGDGACTQEEKNSANCCSDCGCGLASACNFESNKCIREPEISESKIFEVISTLSASEGVQYSVSSTHSEVLEGIPIMVISLRCPSKGGVPCGKIVYLDLSGKIVGSSKAV